MSSPDASPLPPTCALRFEVDLLCHAILSHADVPDIVALACTSASLHALVNAWVSAAGLVLSTSGNVVPHGESVLSRAAALHALFIRTGWASPTLDVTSGSAANLNLVIDDDDDFVYDQAVAALEEADDESDEDGGSPCPPNGSMSFHNLFRTHRACYGTHSDSVGLAIQGGRRFTETSAESVGQEADVVRLGESLRAFLHPLELPPRLLDEPTRATIKRLLPAGRYDVRLVQQPLLSKWETDAHLQAEAESYVLAGRRSYLASSLNADETASGRRYATGFLLLPKFFPRSENEDPPSSSVPPSRALAPPYTLEATMYKLAVDYLRRPDADLEAGQRQASDASLRSATNIARGAHTRHAWEKPKCVKAMAEFTQDNLHWPLVKPLLPTQPSSCLDEEVVDRYASELRRLDGSRRRPTVLLYRGYGGSLLILDGHHKLAACQRVRSTLANPCLNFLILTPLSDGDREHAPRQEVDATYPTTSRANDLTSFSDRMARLHSAWVPFAWQVHRDRCVCSVRRGALAHGRCVCSDCL